MLFGTYFADSIVVKEIHNVLGQIHFTTEFGFIQHAFHGVAVYLAGAGVIAAWYIYLVNPKIAEVLHQKLGFIHRLLDKKYWIDEVYFAVFGKGSRNLGTGFWKIGDVGVIDGFIVNGSARMVGWLSSIVRQVQTGVLYHYAFAMIVGLLLLISWVLMGALGK